MKIRLLFLQRNCIMSATTKPTNATADAHQVPRYNTTNPSYPWSELPASVKLFEFGHESAKRHLPLSTQKVCMSNLVIYDRVQGLAWTPWPSNSWVKGMSRRIPGLTVRRPPDGEIFVVHYVNND
jgi:hypothetical protein